MTEKETPQDRKKRLQAIRAKSEQSKIIRNEKGEAEEKESTIKFKNYKPYDKNLIVKEKNQIINETDKAIIDKEIENSSIIKREEIDIIKRELLQHNDEELNIVPKKPNWDLKSQIEGKMNKLKRKTQRAIVDILREKLAENSDNEVEEENR